MSKKNIKKEEKDEKKPSGSTESDSEKTSLSELFFKQKANLDKKSQKMKWKTNAFSKRKKADKGYQKRIG